MCVSLYNRALFILFSSSELLWASFEFFLMLLLLSLCLEQSCRILWDRKDLNSILPVRTIINKELSRRWGAPFNENSRQGSSTSRQAGWQKNTKQDPLGGLGEEPCHPSTLQPEITWDSECSGCLADYISCSEKYCSWLQILCWLRHVIETTNLKFSICGVALEGSLHQSTVIISRVIRVIDATRPLFPNTRCIVG